MKIIKKLTACAMALAILSSMAISVSAEALTVTYYDGLAHTIEGGFHYEYSDDYNARGRSEARCYHHLTSGEVAVGAIAEHASIGNRHYTKEVNVWSRSYAGQVQTHKYVSTTNRIDWGGVISFDKGIGRDIYADISATSGSDQWSSTYEFVWGYERTFYNGWTLMGGEYISN